MVSKRTTKQPPKKLLLISVSFVVALIAVGGFIYNRRLDDAGKSVTETTQETTPNINLSPPTEQELNETSAHKDSLAKQNQVPEAGSTGKLNVKPVITNASQDEVRGFVPGILEEGGTCIASFSRGSSNFTRQSKGFGNVSTTNCEVISVMRSDFATPGEWTVTLSYTSSKAAGTSQPTTFEVK